MGASKMLTILGAVVVLLLAGIGGIVWLVFSLTAPAADAATRFVGDVAGKGPHQAYMEAAPSLRSAQTEPAFDAKLASMRLSQAATTNWSSRSINNDTATIVGSVRLSSGDAVPMTVDLVKQNKTWLVSDIRYGQPAQTLGSDN